MMTTGGKKHPSSINRIFWAVLQGAVASILMVVGGVRALQSAAIITGAPFAIICVITTLGLIRTFQDDYGTLLLQDRTNLWGRTTSESTQSTATGVAGHDDD